MNECFACLTDNHMCMHCGVLIAHEDEMICKDCEKDLNETQG